MGRVQHYLADRLGVGLLVGPQVNDSRAASATPCTCIRGSRRSRWGLRRSCTS